MKYYELFETPIGNVDFYGSSEPASMRGSDIKAVTNPKSKSNIKRVLEKAPVLIHLVFINHPYSYFSHRTNDPDQVYGDPRRMIKKPDGIFDGKEFASGFYTEEQLKNVYGIDIKADPNAITVAFGFNEGDDRMPFTPWIIAHRIGHALEERNGRPSDFVNLLSAFNKIAEIPWNRSNISGLHPDDLTVVLGTFKSARDNKLLRTGEFVLECFAQYLIQGKITFNKIPSQIPFHRAKRVKSDIKNIIFTDDEIVDKLNRRAESWRVMAEKRFLFVLQECVGKIIVM